MTPNHDDMTDHLGRALHERADGVGAPLTLSDVKGRATRIRRRRAIAATAAAAAAVAIIVPTAIAGSDMFDTSDSGQVATNPTPNPTETGGDAQSWPQSLDTSDLELGEPPQVTWFDGSTMHTPDGDVDLPKDYAAAVRYDDGWLALDYSEGVVVRLDASGAELGSTPSQSPIATSDDGSYVLYVGDGSLILHDNRSGQDTVIGEGHETTEPVDVVDGIAYYNVDEEPGGFPQDGRVWDGGETDPTPGASQPWLDVSADRSTVAHSSIDDFGSCSVLRSAAGEALGETCDFTLDTFSPNGDFLLAGPRYRDGFGDGEIAVLPSTGDGVDHAEVVFHYLRSGDTDPTFLDSVWEDDEHVLAITFTSDGKSAMGTWQILRIGLDGTVENAVQPIEADMEAYPFSLG